MPNVIHKFEIPAPRCTLLLPADARLLHVGIQEDRETPMLWVLLDPTANKTAWEIVVVTTGEVVPYDARVYVGAFQVSDYIGHVFVIPPN